MHSSNQYSFFFSKNLKNLFSFKFAFLHLYFLIMFKIHSFCAFDGGDIVALFPSKSLFAIFRHISSLNFKLLRHRDEMSNNVYSTAHKFQNKLYMFLQ